MSEHADKGHPVEWDAATYHRVSEPQFAWGMRVLERLVLRGDETVLDAGCGSGRLTRALMERLPDGHVIAVDRSSRMVDEARRTLAAFGDRVEYLCADLAELRLARPVDIIFSTATFHWLPDHERLFRALHDCLVPGGLLHAQCGGGANLAKLHARARELMAKAPFAERMQGFTEASNFQSDIATHALLTRLGYSDVHTGLELAPTVFADASEYALFVSTVNLRAHLARLADAALEREFIRRITELAAQDEPPFSLDYVRLNISARRPV